MKKLIYFIFSLLIFIIAFSFFAQSSFAACPPAYSTLAACQATVSCGTGFHAAACTYDYSWGGYCTNGCLADTCTSGSCFSSKSSCTDTAGGYRYNNQRCGFGYCCVYVPTPTPTRRPTATPTPTPIPNNCASSGGGRFCESSVQTCTATDHGTYDATHYCGSGSQICCIGPAPTATPTPMPNNCASSGGGRFCESTIQTCMGADLGTYDATHYCGSGSQICCIAPTPTPTPPPCTSPSTCMGSTACAVTNGTVDPSHYCSGGNICCAPGPTPIPNNCASNGGGRFCESSVQTCTVTDHGTYDANHRCGNTSQICCVPPPPNCTSLGGICASDCPVGYGVAGGTCSNSLDTCCGNTAPTCSSMPLKAADATYSFPGTHSVCAQGTSDPAGGSVPVDAGGYYAPWFSGAGYCTNGTYCDSRATSGFAYEFCNNDSGTIWEFSAIYTFGPNSLYPGRKIAFPAQYPASTYQAGIYPPYGVGDNCAPMDPMFPIYAGEIDLSPIIGVPDTTNVNGKPYNLGYVLNAKQMWQQGDTITWNTACASSTEMLNGNAFGVCMDKRDNDITVYCNTWAYTNSGGLNINCSGDIINGYIASCDKATGLGYVSANAQCPSGPYCMKGGAVAGGTGNRSGPSYCPAAFTSSKVVGTTIGSCTNQATCKASYCDTNNICHNNITDTTGKYCGPTCATAASITINSTCPAGTTLKSQNNVIGDCNATPATPFAIPNTCAGTTIGDAGLTTHIIAANVPSDTTFLGFTVDEQPGAGNSLTCDPATKSCTPYITGIDSATITANCNAIVKVSVYKDTNSNGIYDEGADPLYNGGFSISVSGSGAGSYTDTSSGTITIPNVSPGQASITLNQASIPAGYNIIPISPPDPTNVTVTAPETDVSFLLEPLQLYSVSGSVYADNDNSGNFNTGDITYTDSSVKIGFSCTSGSCLTNSYPASVQTANGLFDSTQALPPGEYLVTAFSPDGYLLTTISPLDLKVGGNCSVVTPGAPGTCATGNITGTMFGISKFHSWIQTTGGDIYQANVSNQIPLDVPAACGGEPSGTGHMSIAAPPTIAQPGIVFSGLDQLNFGVGNASVNNWAIVDAVKLKLKTSYEYLSSLVKDAGITPTDLSSISGCNDLSNCTLPDTLEKGIYIANGNLKLGGGFPSTYAFPSNNGYVILVNGDLTIATDIHIPHTSTVIFAASGDIHVDKSIGTTIPTDDTANIEGYYSTDKSFILDSYGPNNCPATPDKRLNVEGAIIANAIYDTSGSKGTVQVKRDMCGGDVCPTLSVKARPDFVLNAPLLYQFTKGIEQEMAP